MFISPTEPPSLRELGITSNLPETYGADVYWESRMGEVGVQRKQFPGDFISSVTDGRLRTQIGMMQDLDLRILLLEGRGMWSSEGVLMHEYGPSWTDTQLSNFLMSVQLRGVWVQWSSDLPATLRVVKSLQKWTDKTDHLSLWYRPHTGGGNWGQLDSEEYQRYVLQAVPNTGTKKSDAVVSGLGRLPFKPDVTDEELLAIPGIGPGWVEGFRKVFGYGGEKHEKATLATPEV